MTSDGTRGPMTDFLFQEAEQGGHEHGQVLEPYND